MNKVIISGRLTKSPELKTINTGTSVVSFSIAVDSNLPNKATGKKETYFFNCVAWGTQAEFLNNYITKGRLILVEGELKQRTWQKMDGTKASVVEINVNRIEPLEKAQSFQANATQHPTPQQQPVQNTVAPTVGGVSYDPFEGDEQ